MRTWTKEAREKQSAMMRRLKPWLKSTGPKTAAGKAKAAKNSYKTGRYAKPARAIRRHLRDARGFLNFLKTNYYKSSNFRSGKVAIPAGLEPATPCLEGKCSIQLSYGTVSLKSEGGQPAPAGYI